MSISVLRYPSIDRLQQERNFEIVADVVLQNHMHKEQLVYTIFYLLLSFFFVVHSQSIFGEGFLAGTGIKTVCGYKQIEDLDVHDVLIGHDSSGNYCEQRIVCAQQTKITQYVKIFSTHKCLCVAPHQKLYIPSEKKWVAACDLAPETMLSKDFIVQRIEEVDEEVDCFSLTVEHHVFYIEDDVLVHNVDPGSATALYVAAGPNPITAVIGTGVFCIGVATKLYPIVVDVWKVLFRGDSGDGGGDKEKLDEPGFDRVNGPGDPDDGKDSDKNDKNKTFWKNFQKSLEYGHLGNNLNHFFEKSRHGFEVLLNKMGGSKNIEAQKKLVEKVLRELIKNGKLHKPGVFENTYIAIEGYTICVSGFVHEGVIKIGTMFIPS